MKNYLRKTIATILSLSLIFSYTQATVVWANGVASTAGSEASASAEASAPCEMDKAYNIDEDNNSDIDEDTNDKISERNNNSELENNDAAGDEQVGLKSVEGCPFNVEVDSEVVNGTVSNLTFNENNGEITGCVTPDAGYDLATIRVLGTESTQSEEQYLKYTESGNSYEFAFTPENDCRLTAFFYSLSLWDGAVDISWYNPDETEFEIGNPAELAGLAAIVNGTVDTNETEEYMIKDNDGRAVKNGKYTHRYITTESWNADLLSPNVGGQVKDTVWRLPEVEHKKVDGASDDIHNDFLYRTVRLTADIDMGSKNWTPIGGKYAMNPEESKDGSKAHVIDTRFQGVFDGQGHKVTINSDRRSNMGFAYCWAMGLIGYLGGGVDYANGYPKDTYMEYEKYWVPAVRNVVVDGKVEGNRMIGGVVGRTGETNYGVVVENCANYAEIHAKDMRGCAGIVAAAWGVTTIRNCYNAGKIKGDYWEYGGICGSNGYEGSKGREASGASIFNCYNRGQVGFLNRSINDYEYGGHEIGADGKAFAKYKVANCYYEKPDEKKEGESGYYSSNGRAKITEVDGVDDLKSDKVLTALNRNGEVFVKDASSGYPVLYFESEDYVNNPNKYGSANVKIDVSERVTGKISEIVVSGSVNGNILSDLDLTDLPYGTTVELRTSAYKGYKFSHYEVADNDVTDNDVTDNDVTDTISTGDFYMASGKNVSIKAVFSENVEIPISFPTKDDDEDYYVVVTKVYDKSTDTTCSEEMKNGDTVIAGDVIKLKAYMKDNRHPDNKALEYTGECGDPVSTEQSLVKEDSLDKTYEVTGETDQVDISYKPVTQGKRWTTIADTSWYREGNKAYTVSNAYQLAGIAVLCEEGESFEGVTFKMNNDISLKNTYENSGDRFGSERNWTGIGTDHTPFAGTFDGQGKTISNIHRNFANGYCEGSNGGLFGVTDGAKIVNVNVVGGSYNNYDGVKMDCSFKNGANGGGLVGTAISTHIENCDVNISMNKAFDIGGIVGDSEGNTTIKNCHYSGTITGEGTDIGGIVGKINSSGLTIDNCSNAGDISSVGYKVGGIVGNGASSAADIRNCRNIGAISSSMSGASSNAHAIGGIVGVSTGAMKITSCVNNGNVSAMKTTFAVGGIAGAFTKGVLSACYNTGSVYIESNNKKAQIGGITNLGTNKSEIASVKNCYNIGKVVLGESAVTERKGGVIGGGNLNNNIISNSYCSKSSVDNIGDIAVGRTEAGFAGKVIDDDVLKTYAKKLGSSYYVDDLDSVNNGYPVLNWQDEDLVGTVEISKVTKYSDTALNVSWKPSGACSGYEVYRSTSSDGTYSRITTVSKSGTKSYRNTKLTYGKRYYYKVRAYRLIDGTKYYGKYSGYKYYNLVPGRPALSSVSNSASQTALVKWKKVSGASGYYIYRATSVKGSYKKIATIKGGSTLKYKNSKLTKGKTYYYKVRSYKVVSRKTGISDYSSVKSVKIKK